jgi:hypothetical protein
VKLEEIVEFIQGQFTDGLVLVIGSGLSAAEGIPGMPGLAKHLEISATGLKGEDARLWGDIAGALAKNEGLEAALLRYPPSPSLESWITRQTCELLIPEERRVISEVVKGNRTLRLTSFLSRILKPTNGLPILTPNYDRLIEAACEKAGFHVDTTAIGDYVGAFDHTRSCMGSCRGIIYRGKTTALDHFPRAIVLKPHGSFDWYTNPSGPVRCSMEIEADRLMITPGLNKYKAGYSAPFDKHRELANGYIDQANRLLIAGYGFNDDHLQVHLIKRIQAGTPTLILTRTLSKNAEDLAQNSPKCIALSQPSKGSGIAVVTQKARVELSGHDLWDLGVLAREVLT